MTASEAKANQERIAERFDLGWWYGIRCKKCCGVYPKFMKSGDLLKCFYQCEVCGKRTPNDHEMPWLAEEEWNNMTEPEQISLFTLL